MKHICIVGLGYIGLPTAAILAEAGYVVHGVDTNSEIVDIINSGSVHIEEPGLEDLIHRAVSKGLLRASTAPPNEADVFIVCVPTPLKDGTDLPSPDIHYVLSAVKNIAAKIKAGNLVILESTVPLGTTKKMQEYLQELGVDTDSIHIAFCPERIVPGRALYELVENDRVIGGVTELATEKIIKFYSSFIHGQLRGTDSVTAEMVKLSENSFRDLNIAFANELSLLAEEAGVDVWQLIEIANKHPRVHILQPGIGVGGHCIAVDPWFLVDFAPHKARLISEARKVNDFKTQWIIEKIQSSINEFTSTTSKKARIALLGLTFKPDVDDVRESPAIKIAEDLLSSNYELYCVEPHIKNHARLPIVDMEYALNNADIIVLLVKHSVFRVNELNKKCEGKIFLQFVK